MSRASEILAQLRDIHLPPAQEPPSTWPMIAAAVLATIALLWLLGRYRAKRSSWAKEACNKIDALQKAGASDTIAGYAAVLKQTALSLEDNPDRIRHLHGTTWLAYLDKLFNTRYFSTGAGQCFGELLYSNANRLDTESVNSIGKRLQQLIRKRARRSW